MGQKTNPNILRLGVTKNWKTEFFEKNKNELPLYIFKDLEIQDYIERFLEIKGIFIHDYRQYYSNQTLNLYISYFITVKSIIILLKKKKFLLIKKLTGESKIVNYKVSQDLKSNYDFENINGKKSKTSINIEEIYNARKYLKSNIYFRDGILTILNNSLKYIFKVISMFTNNKFDVVINFSCINKDFNYFAAFKTKKIRMLQKFKYASFFEDGLELLFHVSFNHNSARLLSKFIAFHLKTIKRPNFFFSFIKYTLTILISSSLSKLKGVKIIIKGRLRKGLRAKHKILTIGDVAVQSFNSNIDYFQTTTHNANGSYGIKVWIVEK